MSFAARTIRVDHMVRGSVVEPYPSMRDIAHLLRKICCNSRVLALMARGFFRHDVDIAAYLDYNPQRNVVRRLIFV
jgi:hypothetical protein